MGGKSYITAVDASAEVKRKFVENSLIHLPVEKTTKHEVVPRGDRAPNIAVGIEGTYTIVSLVDGSTAVIGGVGDGLASGTAVASNIASTNALKNALLRTFLITEQSVEDAAKNGVAAEDGGNYPVASRAVAAATKNAQAARPDAKRVQQGQEMVREKWAELHPDDTDGYIELGKKLYGKVETWANDVDSLLGLYDAIMKGEVA